MHFKPATDKRYIKLRVADIRQETTDVKTIFLKTASGKPYNYLAGQFLTFVFQGLQGEERRSYSFSSSPDVGEAMSITLKRVPNGRYSRPLTDLKAGDELSAIEAAGRFTLPDDLSGHKQIFFFAAGVGITPVFSLIKTLLATSAHTEAVLVYSSRSREDTIFYRQLLELLALYPGRFKMDLLLSSSADLTKARLSKWLLPQILKKYSSADPGSQLFYTCGPFAYMRMVTLSLEEQGYSPDQIRKENFDTTKPVYRPLPPDMEAHQVGIRFRGQAYTLTSQYPQTILKAAKQAGIMLPYSCETGRCGSCAAICTKGEIWMSNNEVLTDKDIREGKILTCVSYPVYGDVEIVL